MLFGLGFVVMGGGFEVWLGWEVEVVRQWSFLWCAYCYGRSVGLLGTRV